MKRPPSILLIFLLILSLFAGCAEPDPSQTQGSTPTAADISKTDADMFTQRDADADYDARTAITVQLTGTGAAASAGSVQIDGSTVILKEEATYVISGSLNGMLVVDAPESAKLQLVFAGVDISSQTSAALYIRNADKVFLTLADGTENALSNGGSFTAIDENNIDAALFSKQDLTLNGSGALTVTSPAGHGIVCKDDLVITGGNYTIQAASDGLQANDSIRITGAALTIAAGKDAVQASHSEDTALGFVYISGGSLRAEAQGDGIVASSYLQIVGGTIDVLAGGGSENGNKEYSDSYGGFPGRPGSGSTQTTTDTADGTSMKGLKASSNLLISGGSITVNAADDAIHSDLSVTVSGGTLVLASGDDAIHAEDTLTITDGQIIISESYEGLEALHILVQGGNIQLVASDDGLNAAGGVDQSGTEGGRDGMFGGGRPGGFGGGMSTNSNGSILISGGVLYINASGDGLDANGTLTITGGHTTVVGPTGGDTATLDYDVSASISGGTFIGTGASSMAQTFSDSEQGVIAVSVSNQTAGTQITLLDAKGNTLISYAPELDFAVVILSTPEMVKGQTYTLHVGTLSGECEAN